MTRLANVIGLDLSLSGAGVARADGSTYTAKPKPATMRGGARLAFLRDLIVPALTLDGSPVDLVVIEDYSPGSVGLSGKLANAQLRGVIELAAHEAGVTAIALVRPGTCKRFATGNGTADKAAMVRAAQAAGWVGDPKRDDEADAFHLRRMGLAAITGADTAAQQDAVDAVVWPTIDL